MTNDRCLITSLQVLKESAQEAVENTKSFSDFKEYMHINREIEKDLVKFLSVAKGREKGCLIFLAGSVGDGKSHLLSKVNNLHGELLKKFSIHNDATESFIPNQTSIDTLNEVLKSFTDSNIHTTKEKVILAINLGVLNNFIHSKYAKDRFEVLVQMIEDSNVFNVHSVTKRFSEDNPIQIFSFSDYHLFQLGEERPTSPYIKKVINKIIAKDSNNPFYESYCKGCLESCKYREVCPIRKNYEMLSDDTVQNGIINNLIEVIVKEKLIIPTRSLLNFIYEIMVSSEFDNINYNEIQKKFQKEDHGLLYINSLLPSLLFDSKDRSFILEAIQSLDSIHRRNEIIDSLITSIHTSINPVKIIEKNGVKDVEMLKQIHKVKNRETLLKFVLRYQNVYGNNEFDILDKNFYDYMHYLFHFNKGNKREMKYLYRDVEKGIRNWVGSVDKDYVYLAGSNKEYKLVQRLQFDYDYSHIISKEKLEDYFSTSIELRFKNKNEQNEFISLELDYSLFTLLMRIKDGYRPNKRDKEISINFLDFYDKLMNFGEKNNQLRIINKYNESFTLEYDKELQTFIFERNIK